MPKKTKAIPDNRTEWTFGEALYWHFFVFGTRPESSPSDATGTPWNPEKAANACGVSVRGFWNWIDDRHQPYDTINIERALFGDSKLYADARNELRRLLQHARQGAVKTPTKAASGTVPTVLTGQAVTVYNTPFEADEVDGPTTEADFRMVTPFREENFGNSRKTPPQGGALAPPALDPAAESGDAPSAAPSSPSRKTVAVVCAGLLLLLGGYGVKRVLSYPTPVATTATPDPAPPPFTKGTPPESPQPPVVTPKEPTEQERRAAAEKQRQDALRAAAQKKTLDDLEALRQQKENAARDLNTKLKVMAQGDGDLCKQKLEGLSVPGFALKCDTLIPFGKLLRGVGVSQTATSLGDCASRCRRAPDCVAFSFDAGAHAGSASCNLTGSIPETRKADNWISGVR